MSNSDVNFFLVGCERSGTTLLRLMLNAHPNIAIPEESHFIVRLLQHFKSDEILRPEQVKEAFDILVNFRRWQEWDNSKEQLWLKLQAIPAPSLKDIVNCAFELKLEETGKAIWGDKTPKHVMHIQFLKEMYPDAKFIHLIRDGRDVCLSYLKTGWLGPWVSKISQYWSVRVQKASESKQTLPAGKYLEIRYEDLVVNPEQVLREVSLFLGEDYTPAMLEYSDNFEKNLASRELKIHQKLKRQPSSEDLSRWRRELPWWKILTFEAYSSDELQMHGYQRKFASLGLLLYPLTRLLVYILTHTANLRTKVGLVTQKHDT